MNGRSTARPARAKFLASYVSPGVNLVKHTLVICKASATQGARAVQTGSQLRLVGLARGVDVQQRRVRSIATECQAHGHWRGIPCRCVVQSCQLTVTGTDDIVLHLDRRVEEQGVGSLASMRNVVPDRHVLLEQRHQLSGGTLREVVVVSKSQHVGQKLMQRRGTVRRRGLGQIGAVVQAGAPTFILHWHRCRRRVFRLGVRGEGLLLLFFLLLNFNEDACWAAGHKQESQSTVSSNLSLPPLSRPPDSVLLWVTC